MTSANTFAGFPFERAAERRRDEAFLADALRSETARITPFWRAQPFLMEESGASPVASAVWLGPQIASLAGEAPLFVFLGLDAEGAPSFALRLPDALDPETLPIAGLGGFEDLRAAAMRLSPADAAALGCAKALFEWHARNGFCSVCGTATSPRDGGWRRLCPGCGAEHFPRLDPVVIMLAARGDSCCLGRQARFPEGMFSALAGFVEPGESLEEACARELMEEVGLKARAVRYHSSQPWPFPSSLMIGLIAEVEDGEVVLDEEEIVEAAWFTREEARAALAGGLMREGRRLWAPPPIAIAHRLIRAWAEE